MSYCKFISWLFCFLLILSFPVFSQNIALNKSYTLSDKPNYQYSAPSTDMSSLTDGKYTTGGRFWTQPTTVGWTYKNVSITIDLYKIQPIASVVFSTVRASESAIFYPQNIFVFISNDNINYSYIGDAADVKDNLPGTNQEKKFSLTNINQSARFVKFSVIRQGSFVFCDEIEVFKGKNSNRKFLTLVNKDSLPKFIDSLKSPKYNRRGIMRLSKNLQSSMDDTLLNLDLNNDNISFDAGKVQSKLGILNASYLKSKFKESYILEKCNPWSDQDELRKPTINSKLLEYKFYLTGNDVQYGSFILTNLNINKQDLYFEIPTNLICRTELYTVPFVPSAFYNRVADPIVKVEQLVTIEPGESRMFIFKLAGLKKGEINSSIVITSEGDTSKIQYNVNVVDKQPGENFKSLNVNVWAYFKNSMIKGHTKEASDDLTLHHVNTFVIPPTILPKLKDVDFANFKDYLKNFDNAKNVLLFMDYSLPHRKNNNESGQFLSPEWKQNFVKWYNNMERLISEQMGSETKIYLYPFDEVNKNNIDDFKKIVLWARSVIPGIKFYATLNNQISVDSILPIIDVAQILPSLEKKLPPHRSEIWIYTANTPSRVLSPYGFYRLMGWDAFVNDYGGIGFWSYADERNGNNLNLISGKFLNLGGSYSVIYNDTFGNIISSRRWEAFRLGIEDYSILQAYSKRFGQNNAKALAKKVLDKSDDFNLADSTRVKMILELIKK